MENKQFFEMVERERRKAQAAIEFLGNGLVATEEVLLKEAQAAGSSHMFDADHVAEVAAKMGGIALYLKSYS